MEGKGREGEGGEGNGGKERRKGKVTEGRGRDGEGRRQGRPPSYSLAPPEVFSWRRRCLQRRQSFFSLENLAASVMLLSSSEVIFALAFSARLTMLGRAIAKGRSVCLSVRPTVRLSVCRPHCRNTFHIIDRAMVLVS